MNTLTMARQATARIAGNTGAGLIRTVAAGERLEYSEVIASPNGDEWVALGPIDPKTGETWRFQGRETVAYIAVRVSGTQYASVPTVPAPPADWHAEYNKALEDAAALLLLRRK